MNTAIDKDGFRLNVGIVLINSDSHVFWAKQVGRSIWQLPQGGLCKNETTEEALYRELREEIGLCANDVKIKAITKDWIKYNLPKKYIRNNSLPVVIGQKQKWFLLEMVGSESRVKLDGSERPEFDKWRWVDYWHPTRNVIFFKKKVYWQVLKEFAPHIFPSKEGE